MPMQNTPRAAAVLATILFSQLAPSQAQEAVKPQVTPPGAAASAKTRTLEAGARALQGSAPVSGFDIYLVGFHPMKEKPDMQLESHHYCHQVNQDFAQCVLFDGNTSTANMNGIEYIISEKLFNTLPQQERQYWHPHNGEILSGQLVAPGIPEAAEKSLMKEKMNSYGKTWHFWNTGHVDRAADQLPLGEPMLAWSFSRIGELKPGLEDQRDKKLGINTDQKRQDRADLQQAARPQSGVDDLKGKFNRPTKEIPGVVDIKDAGNRPAPPAAGR